VTLDAVAATDDGGGSVRRTVHRTAVGTGVQHCSVEVDGRAGLLILPAEPVPSGGWPAAACFGGSEGGFASQIVHAELLGSLGFAALAACWIPEADAAVAIAKIPLERFTAALEFLAERPEVDAGRLAAMAVSRGAEGLLAAVAARPTGRCRGLVLVSPSSVTWQAIGGDGEVPDTCRGRSVAVPWSGGRCTAASS
jgi:hypothetical protein